MKYSRMGHAAAQNRQRTDGHAALQKTMTGTTDETTHTVLPLSRPFRLFAFQ
jgi:hypothetical protein